MIWYGGHGMPRCFGLASALAQQLCGHAVEAVEEGEMMARCEVVCGFFRASFDGALFDIRSRK